MGAAVNRLTAVLFCLLALLVTPGCQQPVRERIVGQWIGKPDTAAAAAERVAKQQAAAEKKSGDEQDEAVPKQDSTAKLGVTDLEGHDVTILLYFNSDKTVKMSLGDESQPREGVWRVVESLPPQGAEIEISLTTKAEPGAEDEKPSKQKSVEKRRFIIDFQQQDDSTGFTLIEKGADPKFGRLYFEQKAKK